MDPIQLKSGASLAVTIAPYAAGKHLLKVVARELAGIQFDLDLDNIDDISGKDVNVLKNVAFQLIQSDAVEAALAKCMEKCVYNGERIVATTFEPAEARPDYLPVSWEVMKANLGPFFKGLGLSFMGSERPKSTAPRSD